MATSSDGKQPQQQQARAEKYTREDGGNEIDSVYEAEREGLSSREW